MSTIKKEQNIKKILKEFLPSVETKFSILKGDLLEKSEKKFIFNNPNAFIIGLIAGQSVKAELAWSLPYNLYKRLGTFDFKVIIKNFDVLTLEQVIKQKPALHRYPNRMANYIYLAIKKIVNEYNGNAKEIWQNQKASVIVQRLEEFKGISHKKASLGTLLLVRDLDVNIEDKNNIDIAYDVHIRRIFLRMGLVDKDTQDNVVNEAKKINPEFPGELTTSFWAIGREYCFANNPDCINCPLKDCCEEYNNIKRNKKVGV